MKKIYLLAFSFIAISQANAQVTLTKAANEPVIGDTYDTKDLDTTNVLPMAISGSNVTWNVTGVSETGGLTTNNFVNPSTDPNAANFPGTTIVQSDGNASSYFKSSASLYELLGLDAGMFVLNYNTNAATVAAYPISFGYVNNDIGAGAVTASTLSGTFSSTINTTADGTGTLNFNGIPTSNYSNCLRVKTSQHVSFSLAGGLITGTMDMVIYNFYVSGTKFPIFTVNYSNINAPAAGINNQRQDQASALSSVVLGLGEKKMNDIIFKVYPNPANGEVSLHFVLTQKESYTIEVVNALGQVVKSVSKPDLQPGLYNEAIDIQGLSAGVYHVRVQGKNASGVEKLIVQ